MRLADIKVGERYDAGYDGIVVVTDIRTDTKHVNSGARWDSTGHTSTRKWVEIEVESRTYWTGESKLTRKLVAPVAIKRPAAEREAEEAAKAAAKGTQAQVIADLGARIGMPDAVQANYNAGTRETESNRVRVTLTLEQARTLIGRLT